MHPNDWADYGMTMHVSTPRKEERQRYGIQPIFCFDLCHYCAATAAAVLLSFTATPRGPYAFCILIQFLVLHKPHFMSDGVHRLWKHWKTSEKDVCVLIFSSKK